MPLCKNHENLGQHTLHMHDCLRLIQLEDDTRCHNELLSIMSSALVSLMQTHPRSWFRPATPTPHHCILGCIADLMQPALVTAPVKA